MDSSGHSIIWLYLGFILLVSSPSAIFAFFMNHRKKKITRTLCTDRVYFVHDLDANF